MKNKILLLIVTIVTTSLFVRAQSFDDVLKSIETNNKQIQAGLKQLESNKLLYRKDNFPSGPEVSYGYFPNNSSVPATKETFEVSQSFQMPCYYRNQSAYSKMLMSQEELKQAVLRQDILFEAKNLLIEYIFLMKQAYVTDKRLKFAEDIYNGFLVRLEAGDANALETNKAKLNLLQVQRMSSEVKTNLLATKEKLKNLNGGTDIVINIDDYPTENLVGLDSVIFEKFETDPSILLNKNSVQASAKKVQVTKNLQLPEFNLGYGSETVGPEKFKGLIAGFTIPLWGSKNAIKQAKIESDFYSINSESVSELLLTDTKVQFQKVMSLKENLTTYENVLSSVNNEELLTKSLELGEISVLDFFTEMYYYYEVYDDFLKIEKEYHQAVSELYKFKL